MKVLLSTPPGRTTEKWPPLGLLYLASNLRKERDDEVVVCDAFCADWDRSELLSRIIQEKPDVIGLSCSTHTFLKAIAVLEKVREALPQSIILMGGYHATFATESILRSYPFIDYILRGEAEHSLVSLLDSLDKGDEPKTVQGICYMKKGELVKRPICLVEDLDSLPFPDRSALVGIRYGYTHQGIPLTFGKFTTISSSRGCPFRCSYCSCAAFSLNRWRPRSAENVVQELEEIYSDGFESCVFVDDNFTHDKRRVMRICELIKKRRIRLRMYCEGRVDSASKELLLTMKKAGFDVIYFGAESASQSTLDYFNKHITPEKTAQAIANAKESGMLVITSFIFGAPVEKDEDLITTLNFIREVRPHAIQVNILDCLPGTKIWDEMSQHGFIRPDDWKSNHRIYEYECARSKQELQDLVNSAYSEWLKGWWSGRGVKEFFSTLLRNHTARRIVFSNILNRNVRTQIRRGMKPF
ncbi:MAG: radical SAM protein [Methanomassiliicoccales archaeon]